MPEAPRGDMPEDGQHGLQPPVDPEAFRNWTPEAQAKALELIRQRQEENWRPFFCPRPHCDGNPHDDGTWDWQHARADQRPPKWSDPWLVMLMAGGRGSGKTRTGSEITHKVAERVPRMALVAATGPDVRDTLVEGVSGILATSPPGKRPLWEPSKRRLTWPNGCIAQGFSAEEPDRLRGPQFGFAWLDEPAHYPLIDDIWSNLLFGLRLGSNPKIVCTSTPKPTKWMKALVSDKKTVLHRVSTYANLVNLADTFRDAVLERYEGTRLGRQELHGELLEDVEGALWVWDWFDWIEADWPHMKSIAVSVDPAGSANERSDETGIITVGGNDKQSFVLSDDTGRYSPAAWGDKAIDAYLDHNADAIVAEKNYGGDMVRHVIEVAAEKRGIYPPPPIKLVQSRRGKKLRAEPIAALYEKGRVKHLGKQGDLADLEDEMTTWVPGEGASPNRVDALVHGITYIGKAHLPVSVANPNNVLRFPRQAG